MCKTFSGTKYLFLYFRSYEVIRVIKKVRLIDLTLSLSHKEIYYKIYLPDEEVVVRISKENGDSY